MRFSVGSWEATRGGTAGPAEPMLIISILAHDDDNETSRGADAGRGAETKNFTGHLGLMSQIIAAFLCSGNRERNTQD